MAKKPAKSRHGSGDNVTGSNGIRLANPKLAGLTFKPTPQWHAFELPDLPARTVTQDASAHILQNLHSHAKALLEKETERYEASQARSSSSHKFMSSIMASGTWSDKVSALTLVVQESPLHTSKALENLINMAGKRSRTQALMALAALKDMLAQGTLLPADRKLKSFNKQPDLLSALQSVKSWTAQEPLPGAVTEQHLIFWAYEDFLKRSYFEILKILEVWASDEVEFSRLRAVTFVWELLKEKPEQEENLLRLLVNKLGDTEKKVASRASHLLLQLQVTHPSMKSVVIDSLESEILLRPGQSSHAKYYAVITLNQTILQQAHPEVANRLLDVYFGLFITILNKSKHPKAQLARPEQSKKRKRGTTKSMNDQQVPEQELDDKIVGQVLTGVNRAFPFSKKDSDVFEKHLDTMFRITHSSNFNTSVQALLLIQQISATHQISTDRFMRTLYESMLDPRLINSSKHTMYLNLLYRSLKSDASPRRVKAFVKRLLQILTFHEPPFVCSALYLVVELQKAFPGIKVMLDQSETASGDDEEENFADVPEPGEEIAIDKPRTEMTHASLYDGRKRDPEHSNADRTCLWELSPWLTHYHPSATIFAQHLLHPSRGKAPPKPDPNTHTLAHFLDRFVYKHPKQRPDAHMRGTSLMQPALAATNTVDSLFVPSASVPGASAAGVGEIELNNEAFWKRRVDEVEPDQVFFHRYFASANKGRKEKADKKAAKKKGGDVDEDGDEFDEDEVWKALVNSQPELAGEGGESSDEEEFEMSDDEDDMSDMEVDVEGDGALEETGEDEGSMNLEDEEGSALFSSESEAEPEKEQDKAGIDSQRVDKKRKRRIRDLPTFASAEDYAHLLDQEGSHDEDS